MKLPVWVDLAELHSDWLRPTLMPLPSRQQSVPSKSKQRQVYWLLWINLGLDVVVQNEPQSDATPLSFAAKLQNWERNILSLGTGNIFKFTENRVSDKSSISEYTWPGFHETDLRRRASENCCLPKGCPETPRPLCLRYRWGQSWTR